MKAYEAAKKLGVTNKEFLAEHGLSSHLCKIPSELEDELFGKTVDSAETVIINQRFARPPKKKPWVYKR